METILHKDGDTVVDVMSPSHPFAFTIAGAVPMVEAHTPPATRAMPATKRTGASNRKPCCGAMILRDGRAHMGMWRVTVGSAFMWATGRERPMKGAHLLMSGSM